MNYTVHEPCESECFMCVFTRWQAGAELTYITCMRYQRHFYAARATSDLEEPKKSQSRCCFFSQPADGGEWWVYNKNCG